MLSPFARGEHSLWHRINNKHKKSCLLEREARLPTEEFAKLSENRGFARYIDPA